MNLRELLKEKGITPYRLGKMIGLSKGNSNRVYTWISENPRTYHTPILPYREKIAKALKVSVKEIDDLFID